MAVHDLGRIVHLFVRSACENEDPSAPHSLHVSSRLPIACPDRLELPVQAHLEIGAWSTRDSVARHFPRLPENADLVPGEGPGIEVMDDLVRYARMFKQSNCRFRHIAPLDKVLVQPKISVLLPHFKHEKGRT